MRGSLLRCFGCFSLTLVGLAGCDSVSLSDVVAGLGGGADVGRGGGATGGSARKLAADLVGSAAGSVRVEWSIEGTRTTFHVEVESGEAGAVLPIVVDGVAVGDLTLNDMGFGELEFRDSPDDNPDANEVAFPENFPNPLLEGAMVGVGDLEGTLASVAPADSDGNDDSGDDSGDDDSMGGGSGDGATTTRLRAELLGPGEAKGHAEWEVGPERSSLTIEVESGEPDSVLDIVVDGVTLGQLTLDGMGLGEIEFRDPPDDNPGPNEFPFPLNFLSPLKEGSVIAVGDLEGTLAALPSDDSGTDHGSGDDDSTGDDSGTDDGTGTDDGSGDGAMTLTSLRAVLAGPGGASGQADWEVRTNRKSFKVEVESGMAGAMLDIVVDGVTVGQLTLNVFGFGELEYRDPPDDNPGVNQVPFPADFPSTVDVGTSVSVGMLMGELRATP